MAFDPNDEADKKLLADAITKAVEEATTGLQEKNREVIGKQKELKDQIARLMKSTEGVDIEKLRELQGKLEKDEESRMILEGKTHEVIERRTERMRADHDKQLKEANEKADKNLQFANRFRDSALANAIRDAAGKNGVEAGAVEDVIYRAKAAGFTVDDNAVAVLKDEKGDVVLGKDGKTPLEPSEWVEGLREKAPHLWPKAAGGGADGGGHASGKKVFKDMSEKERIEYSKSDPEGFKRDADALKQSRTSSTL